MRKKAFSLSNISYSSTLNPINKRKALIVNNDTFIRNCISNDHNSKNRNSIKPVSTYTQTTKASSLKSKKKRESVTFLNHKDYVTFMVNKITLEEEQKQNPFKGTNHFQKHHCSKPRNNIHSFIKEDKDEEKDNNEQYLLNNSHSDSQINSEGKIPACKSIIDLNKKIMNTHTYQDEDEIKYSKQNLKTYSQFLVNQKEKNAQKSELLNRQFYRLKNGRQNTVTFSKEKNDQLQIDTVANMMDDNKMIIRNNLNDNARDFAKKLLTINNKKKIKVSHEREKINYFLLDKKIKVLKMIQRRRLKESQLEKTIRMISKYTLAKNEDKELILLLVGSPSFLSTKFKQQTVTKMIGSGGKYFGSPV